MHMAHSFRSYIHKTHGLDGLCVEASSEYSSEISFVLGIHRMQNNENERNNVALAREW